MDKQFEYTLLTTKSIHYSDPIYLLALFSLSVSGDLSDLLANKLSEDGYSQQLDSFIETIQDTEGLIKASEVYNVRE